MSEALAEFVEVIAAIAAVEWASGERGFVEVDRSLLSALAILTADPRNASARLLGNAGTFDRLRTDGVDRLFGVELRAVDGRPPGERLHYVQPRPRRDPLLFGASA